MGNRACRVMQAGNCIGLQFPNNGCPQQALKPSRPEAQPEQRPAAGDGSMHGGRHQQGGPGGPLRMTPLPMLDPLAEPARPPLDWGSAVGNIEDAKMAADALRVGTARARLGPLRGKIFRSGRAGRGAVDLSTISLRCITLQTLKELKVLRHRGVRDAAQALARPARAKVLGGHHVQDDGHPGALPPARLPRRTRRRPPPPLLPSPCAAPQPTCYRR